MKKIKFDFLFPFIVLLALVFALSNLMFGIPPLGKLLNPFIGAIQNDNDNDLDNPSLEINKIGTQKPVSVIFDKRKVPHIFAENSTDLYFAQGYVTASLRFWQMDFMSYVTAGRLSEIIVQPDLLAFDRDKRRIGALEAAKSSLKLIEKDTATIRALSAYTRGVNAYVSHLDYKSMPFEYKLLDYKPEPWTNLKSVLVFASLGSTLTGYDEDFLMSKMLAVLGEKKFNQLFPDFTNHITPVSGMVTHSQVNKSFDLKKSDVLNIASLSNSRISASQYNPRLGSNSWAVSGKRTKSGLPIFASDPHLGLLLPSFWVEMQLTCPDVNVYGASIPGVPAIIIGFNQNIAWGITNGADDVRDWYKLNISTDYKKYEMDGKWLNLNYRIDTFFRKSKEPFFDTVYSSIHGPIMINKSFTNNQPELIDYALKWELHRPTNPFITFIKLNQARNYNDYQRAIKSYSFPTMNFTFASNDNTIAVTHQGNMAIKKNGQGRFIQDGTKSSEIYTNYISEDELPRSLNPSSGYVVSANQHPTTNDYSHYYNGYYIETRANQIGRELDKRNDFDLNQMKAVQLSNVNSFAVDAIPIFLEVLNKTTLSKDMAEMMTSISKWNGSYDIKNKDAEFFELWLKSIKKITWDEFDQQSLPSPSNYVLLDLIKSDSLNTYFDIMETPKKETANDVVTMAFVKAFKEYQQIKLKGSVEWGDLNKLSFVHLSNKEALGIYEVHSSGHPDAIDAKSGGWGPSWRMIVQLGKKPTAIGIYPGGQSANVGSKYFASFIKDWNSGKYYSLNFFGSSSEAKSFSSSTWLLK